MKRFLCAVTLAAVIWWPAVEQAGASQFCGCNGVVKLSFAQQGEAQPTLTTTPDEDGFLHADLWAVLDEVVQVEGPGGVFLSIGGMELELKISGAEPVSIAKKLPLIGPEIGPRPTAVWMGVKGGARLVDGRLVLAQWHVTLPGDATDVRFDLDPAGTPTCANLADCRESGASAFYVGTVENQQAHLGFGAGYAPAVVNPTQEHDLAPVACRIPFQAVGVFWPRR